VRWFLIKVCTKVCTNLCTNFLAGESAMGPILADLCHVSHRTYNSVIGFNAIRCSKRLGCRVSKLVAPTATTFRVALY